ncbi:MAG: MlaD family protein [Treponema sp.]|nr:MlaD family protein [Treponema sp.]
MKFSIRFADQIVGALIILALAIVIFVVLMLGRSQRWFSRDYNYVTYFNSARGLSGNMAVQHRGFTIGHVKSITLTEEDRVEVTFTIFDIYNDRVREGSLVEVLVNPIGLGNEFMFYPGVGTEQMPEGSYIPSVNSSAGRRLLASGLAVRPERDDSINNLINVVGTLLSDLQEAVEGTDRTSLGRTLGSAETAAAGLSSRVDDFGSVLNIFIAELDPILVNLRDFTDKLSDPSGTVMSILDSDGPIYTDLVDSLDSISGILGNLEKVSDFIPAQLPQIASLLSELNIALRTAEDVLIALTNNPLLRGGIPQRIETRPGGAGLRDLEF